VSFAPVRTKIRPALGLLAPALAALALTFAASPAAAKPHSEQRLVVRADATAVDGPCDIDVCKINLTDGLFRGTPVGTGPYAGSLRLAVREGFPNGEGGTCAPLRARLVLGAGTPNRLILAASGDSCQDGAGPLETASFTGLAEFTVKRGRGRYYGAAGSGLASLTEDADNRHRLTLIGRISR
jgi:hypothetical protein